MNKFLIWIKVLIWIKFLYRLHKISYVEYIWLKLITKLMWIWINFLYEQNFLYEWIPYVNKISYD